MLKASIRLSLVYMFLFPANAQETAKGGKLAAFPEPYQSILPVVAYQPESPLEFLRVQALHNIDGGGFQIFQVRNRAAKPIRSYMIATITSAGTGAVWGNGKTPLQEALLPGHETPERMEDWKINIVTAPEKRKGSFDAKGPMKGIVVFMIVRVEFGDGSTYSAEAEYEALREFFEKNAARSN